MSGGPGHDPLIGTLAANYQLVARLGSGGMGEVYKGVHTSIGSRVAIKVLHPTIRSEAETEQRFLREAQAVNRIAHEGIVKVLDAGRLATGQPYLVMELLEGRSLSEQLRAGGLTIVDACRVMADVLDALAAAHAVGVVHRDLKPANIFLTRTGRTVVLDFGIAKLIGNEGPERLTRTGTAVGTPHYMAPEQIADREVGPATDLYSAGVVLFEVLCGRVPFDGPLIEIMNAHLYGQPPPPQVLRPEVPVAISEVVLKALKKTPADRFASAAAMRGALCATSGVAPSVAASASGIAFNHGAPDAAPHRPLGSELATEHVPDGPPVAAGRQAAPPPKLATPTAPRSRPWLAGLAGGMVVAIIALVAWQLDRSGAATPVTAASSTSDPAFKPVEPRSTTVPIDAAPSDEPRAAWGDERRLRAPREPGEPGEPGAPGEPEPPGERDLDIEPDVSAAHSSGEGETVRGSRGSCQSAVAINYNDMQRITCEPDGTEAWACRCERKNRLVRTCKTSVESPCSEQNCCGF